MEIDFDKVKDIHHSIAIIPTENMSSEMMFAYNVLHSKYPKKQIFILEPQNSVCFHKLPQYDFFIIFSSICSLHQPNNIDFIQVNNTHKNIKDIIISRFKDDHTSFLISRLSKIEKIKTKSIFGIFFSSPKFLFLAQRVRRLLHDFDKISYLIHLNDITNERLTCVDGIEVVVLITCPSMFEFDMEVFVPVVTPFEVQLAFCGDENWDGHYETNRFEPNQNSSNDIALIENKIDILRTKFIKNNNVSVSYCIENETDSIVDGRRGIASIYDNEDKQDNDKKR